MDSDTANIILGVSLRQGISGDSFLRAYCFGMWHGLIMTSGLMDRSSCMDSLRWELDRGQK